jgi:signal transduction histidine kinase
MFDQTTDIKFLKANKLIYYFVLLISFLSVAIDFFKTEHTSQQFYLNSFITGVVLISFSLTFVKQISLRVNFTAFIYVLLFYTLMTQFFNTDTIRASFYLLQNTLIAFILITFTGLFTHQGHILAFGLTYSFVSGIITYINYNNVFPESYSIVIVFISLYSVFMFFSSKMMKKYFHNYFINNSKINNQNKELSQQAQTLYEINKLLSQQTSEIRSQQNELVKLNSTKDKFLSLFAHDIKTPMSSIIGFTELLEMKYNDLKPNKVVQYIKTIKNSAKTTFNLIENLLEWSMSQSNNIAYNPENHKLSHIVDEVIDLLKASAEKKKLSLVKKNIDQTSVYADKHMITTIFRNLVANAIKYSNMNEDITISAIDYQTKTSISVTDKGVGMTKEQIHSLFKIESTNITIGTSGEKGTGLGLLICKDFLKRHNSDFKVTSQPDEGTTFSFELPISKA